MKENADRARALDTAELNKQLGDSAEQLFRLRFQMSMGQMEGLKKYRSLRRERARMLTVLAERESGGEAPTAAAPARGKASKAKPHAEARPAMPAKARARQAKPASGAARKARAAAPRAAGRKATAKPKATQRARKSSKG